MAFNETYNRQIIERLQDVLKLNPATDAIPKAVIPTIQPVFEVLERSCTIVRSGLGTTSGTGVTLYTTPTDKDFYLVAFTHNVLKDATCDAASSTHAINVIIDGTTQNISRIPVLTLTAQDRGIAASLPIPVKIDRNTAISLSSPTFTAGSFQRSATIVGFLVDSGSQLA